MADPIVKGRARVGRGVAGLLCLTLLTACAVGPEFKAPTPTLPAQWRTPALQASAQAEVPVEGRTWWRDFDDPVLDDLEARAASGNLDLRLALERVNAARIARGAARAESAPIASGSAGYARERVSTADIAPVARNILGLPQAPKLPKQVGFDIYSVGAGASWELDLWGDKARRREGAEASLEAAQAQGRGVALTIEAEVAQAYFQLRGLQAEHAARVRGLALADEQARLFEALRARGLAAEADGVEILAQVRALQAEIAGLEQDQADLARALSVLVGADPGRDPFDLTAPASVSRLPPAPVSLPSQMARRRPDIVAAEAQLRAATAAIGAAQADFYPQISLTGQLSIDVTDIKSFGWDARNTSFGPSLSIPLFSGGRLERILDLRRSEERTAALEYRQAVVNAWREVEDALTGIRAAAEQSRQAEAELAARRLRAERLAQRLARGDIAGSAVLEARGAAVAAELQATRTRTGALLAEIQLRRALGG